MQDSTPVATEEASVSSDPPAHYFLFAVQLHFRKEEAVRHRTMNVISESPEAFINQNTLREAQLASMKRLTQENSINEDDVIDVIILNITYMGYMTKEMFLVDTTAP